MLGIGVHSHSRNAEIDMKQIAILNGPIVLRGGEFENSSWPNNIDIALKPSGVILFLDLFSQPPFHILPEISKNPNYIIYQNGEILQTSVVVFPG